MLWPFSAQHLSAPVVAMADPLAIAVLALGAGVLGSGLAYPVPPAALVMALLAVVSTAKLTTRAWASRAYVEAAANNRTTGRSGRRGSRVGFLDDLGVLRSPTRRPCARMDSGWLESRHSPALRTGAHTRRPVRTPLACRLRDGAQVLPTLPFGFVT